MDRKKLIENVIIACKKSKTKPNIPLINKFAELFLSKSPIEDIQGISVNDWAPIIYNQFQLLENLENDLFNFSINEIKETEGMRVNFALVSKDVPFLVDSLRMLFTRNGFQVVGVVNTASVVCDRGSSNEIKDVSYSTTNIGLDNTQNYALLFFQLIKINFTKSVTILHKEINDVMTDILYAVEDWPNMLGHVDQIKEIYKLFSNEKFPGLDEIVEFLTWLKEYFTFIGFREYVRKGSKLVLLEGSELGVLRRKNTQKRYKPINTPVVKDNLIEISKSSAISSIHRNVQTDLICLKIIDSEGNWVGEMRFVGLFTSDAFDSDPLRIPLLRNKIKQVIENSNLTTSRFSRKKLLYILRSLPREELFQSSTPELYKLALSIYDLQDRYLFRAFFRYDPNMRFVSCHVFLPRTNYNTNVYNRIKALLCQKTKGQFVSGIPAFKGPANAYLHFIIRKNNDSELVKVDQEEISKLIQDLSESWLDLYYRALVNEKGYKLGQRFFYKYNDAFESGYQAYYSPNTAILDSELIESMSIKNPVHFILYQGSRVNDRGFYIKILQFNNDRITLSNLLPILENLSLDVIREQSFRLNVSENTDIIINDIMVYPKFTDNVDINRLKLTLIPCLEALYYGRIENDYLNSLVTVAGLTYQDALIARIYCRYLHQLNFGLSDQYIYNCLIDQYKITKMILNLFYQIFSPESDKQRNEQARYAKTILNKIEVVEDLDQDRVLRQLLSMIAATLRTNFFTENHGSVCIKVKSSGIPHMPLPIPMFEAFVYSVEFEGIHLRGGKVARGGLRWSNRREDFRTEILGLMTAQQVKNSIIVPAGAKGGFVLKVAPDENQSMQELGLQSYKRFIGALLSICDNVQREKVVKPKKIKCYDDDDPYFVVAADKGTATFSDTANSIAKEYDFWLDDAFASGGRFGYDHKQLAITAKGAWQSVIWHFQTLKIPMDKPFTVVGIGDMAGDVFGNGMLLSKQIKLIAAFNHESIFIDPNPDLNVSFKERERLFKKPYSRWSDYDRSLISKGGGVYDRSLKKITLSRQAIKALGINTLDIAKTSFNPHQVIQFILQAEVDLLWNGGIGTYVKASDQTHQSVGDKFNDNNRVNANQVRARVVAEGGNLGFTQLARVEYEGKINADFIDNSGGVDCSDVEVNTKILLNSAIKKKKITFEERNEIMLSILDEVIADILSRNAMQNNIISLAQFQFPKSMVLFLNYLHWLEDNNVIDRVLCGISSDAKLLSRNYFTRPEIAILLSNTILWIKNQIRNSSLLKTKIANNFLYKGFSKTLVDRFKSEIDDHYLKDEIITTQLANHFVCDVGVTFVHQLSGEFNRTFEEIMIAYLIARRIINYETKRAILDGIKSEISAELCIEIMDVFRRLIRRLVRILLSQQYNLKDICKNLNAFADRTEVFFQACCDYESENNISKRFLEIFKDEKISEKKSEELIKVSHYWHVLTIMDGALKTKNTPANFVKQYFVLRSHLQIDEIIQRLDHCNLSDYIDNISKISLKFGLEHIFLELVVEMFKKKIPSDDWISRIEQCSANWVSITQALLTNQPMNLNSFVVVNRVLNDMKVIV